PVGEAFGHVAIDDKIITAGWKDFAYDSDIIRHERSSSSPRFDNNAAKCLRAGWKHNGIQRGIDTHHILLEAGENKSIHQSQIVNCFANLFHVVGIGRVRLADEHETSV